MFPFRYFSHFLGKANLETSHTPASHPAKLKQIKRAILIASRNVPWQSKCLVQAISAMLILKRNGIASTLYLGVNKKEEKLKTHAWLRSGDFFVTGEENKDDYIMIASFAKETSFSLGKEG